MRFLFVCLFLFTVFSFSSSFDDYDDDGYPEYGPTYLPFSDTDEAGSETFLLFFFLRKSGISPVYSR